MISLTLANNFLKRFLGLMGRKTLNENQGILITPCNGVHTFFMRFPIDIIFVSKENIVLDFYEGLKPWKLTKIIKNSKYVIELNKGLISKLNIIKMGELPNGTFLCE